MTCPNAYDFVIIGGGTAGLVVATRLSDGYKHNVLVIEAGADHTENSQVQIPALFDSLKGTDLDWKFKSEPHPALGGRIIDLNQGKALGGSSAINAFVFVPPTKRLIDSWQESENGGWNWDNLQPYFSKSYAPPPSTDTSSSISLSMDELATSNKDAIGPIQTSFLGSCTDLVRENGIKAFDVEHRLMRGDPFVSPSVGTFSFLSSIHPETKERSYSASAYYLPVRDRENIHVLTNAEATKVVFDKAEVDRATHASGVEYKDRGTTSIKEVILAAGALQSPKILELSGVGDEKLLHQLGIEVVVDLPAVGENLQDHVLASISFKAIDAVDTVDTLGALVRQEREAVTQAMQDYGNNRTSPMSHVGVTSYAYLPINSPQGHQAVEELLNHNRPHAGGFSSQRNLAYFEIAERSLLDPNEPTAGYLSVSAQTAQSTGSLAMPSRGPLPVHIQSKDHSASPVIDPKYLSSPVDMEALAQHMLEIERIASTSSMSKLLKQLLRRGDPASHITTAEVAKQYLRNCAISMWHFGCTYAMLPKDKGGIVDTDLEVHGIDNLRVVDASALPTISTVNLQATIYAFAERAYDILKAARGNE
ncbi:hypothetical protein RRF57_009591 [Xylaria bambusicola]|uniref:Glucose-methanol-choline oxidoreductase N-terminal domain-containing protein n=1 Tax=Xylaria bambusicola TaxID=326684 RepID=A0AAN7Z929_9PEZI